MPTSTLTLTTRLATLPGVGERRAAEFERLGLRCVADLLLHLPLRYERDLGERTIADLRDDDDADARVEVRGTVAAVRVARGRKPRIEATLEDGSASLLLTWFNMPWLRGRLHPGQVIRVSGRLTRRGRYLQMVNPRWSVVPDADDEAARPAPEDAPAALGAPAARLRPVYPASERLDGATIAGLVDRVLDPALALVEDHLPEDYRREHDLADLAAAIRLVHRPADDGDVARGRRRLAFDELLLLQLAVMMKRDERRRTLRAPALPRTETLDAHIRARFPFALTEGQRIAIEEIAGDLARTVPMNRLLQGEVGAGKTVVALYAMLLAVADGHQAALLAPTELLAEQHERSIRAMLAGASVRIERVTGSDGAARRRDVRAAIAAGDVDLVVGTHALLTEHVAFADLAVAVIDEQHRFGVHQRATMRAKSAEPESCPHVLVMTATPIPRTLSLTVFGDLDVSTIRGLPPGRQPVITRHVGLDERPVVYDFVRERIDAGDQAYVLVPVIDESADGLLDLESHLAFLREGPLRGVRVEPMHGRLTADEREATMAAFRAGDVRVLVATTVIEVGVDVPAATIMVIEHADRFGLAQLHQLRGRVGRGTGRGLCVLLADPVTDDARARLAALVASNDGFAIAERDLEIRGPGELFGARQSGLAPLRVARLPRDLALLQRARRDAERWIERDPTLEHDPLLRRRVLKAHGAMLGVGDVG